MGLWADDLVNQYWSLGVSTSSGPVTISCNRYLMNGGSYKPMQDSIQGVQSQAPGKKLGIFVDRWAFLRTYYGKGLPTDMEHVLQVGVDSGVLPSTQTDLQKWADTSLGVDCTGFVSAYHFQCGMMPLTDGVNAGCGYFYRMAKSRNGAKMFVWNLEDIKPDDVMLWMDDSGKETKHPGHIAMIVGRAGNTLTVAESSGAYDKQGHFGPHIVDKTWNGVKQTAAGAKYLNIGEGVIIVRTINF